VQTQREDGSVAPTASLGDDDDDDDDENNNHQIIRKSNLKNEGKYRPSV